MPTTDRPMQREYSLKSDEGRRFANIHAKYGIENGRI
jgi:hypothetical protein